MNSAPKTELSMIACFLLNQSIRAVFMNIKYPVRDCRVILSPVWSLFFVPTYPELDFDTFNDGSEWKTFYGDLTKAIPPNAPNPHT